MSVSIALTSSLIVTPDVVAKPSGKAQPVIVLSQLQPFGTPLLPPVAGNKAENSLNGWQKTCRCSER